MSMFERISLLVRSNINALISKAEDPEKVLNQLIDDMRKEFVDAKKHVAMSIADERRLFRQHEKAQKEAEGWEQKAMQAIGAGREDLARAAMERKLSADASAAEYKQLWDNQRNAADQLRASLVKLNQKIEEASRKKNILIARAKRAEAQKSIQEAMGSIGASSAFSHFERMEQKVDQLEAEAEGAEILSGDIDAMGSGGLDAQFAEMEAEQRSSEADVALLALKQKMGLLPAEAGRIGSDPSGSASS